MSTTIPDPRLPLFLIAAVMVVLTPGLRGLGSTEVLTTETLGPGSPAAGGSAGGGGGGRPGRSPGVGVGPAACHPGGRRPAGPIELERGARPKARTGQREVGDRARLTPPALLLLIEAEQEIQL